MSALSIVETVNRLSAYRKQDTKRLNETGSNSVEIDRQTLAYAEYWLRYAIEHGVNDEITQEGRRSGNELLL